MLTERAFTDSLCTFTVFAAVHRPAHLRALARPGAAGAPAALRAGVLPVGVLPADRVLLRRGLADLEDVDLQRGPLRPANTVLGWFGDREHRLARHRRPALVLAGHRHRAAVAPVRLLHDPVPGRAAAHPAASCTRPPAIDGAKPGWQTFRHITLPQLRATSVAVILLLLIAAYQAFDEFYNLLPQDHLTHGRRWSTCTTRPSAQSQDYGAGSAGALILTAAHRDRDPAPGQDHRLRKGGQLSDHLHPPPRSAAVQRAVARTAPAASAVYIVAVVAALLFLVPFYLLIRNALATDADITGRELEVLPDRPAAGRTSPSCSTTPRCPWRAACGTRSSSAVLRTAGQLLVCSLAGYGAGPHPVPARQQGLLRGAGHPDGPQRGHLRAQLRPGVVTGLGSHLRGLIVPGLFSGFTCLPVPAVLPGLPQGAGGGGPGGRARLLGRVLADRRAQLAGFFAAIAAITFISGWNAFLWPLVIGQDPSPAGRSRWRCRPS